MKIRIINFTSRAFGLQRNLNWADDGLSIASSLSLLAQLMVECFGDTCRDNNYDCRLSCRSDLGTMPKE